MKRIKIPSLFHNLPPELKTYLEVFPVLSSLSLLDKRKVGGNSFYPHNCDQMQNNQVSFSTVSQSGIKFTSLNSYLLAHSATYFAIGVSCRYPPHLLQIQPEANCDGPTLIRSDQWRRLWEPKLSRLLSI